MNEKFDPDSLPRVADVGGITAVDTYSLKPGDVIVLHIAEGQAEWQARLLSEQMVQFLAGKQLEGVHVLALTPGQTLTVLSEDTMRRAGWVRAVPEALPA